MFCKKCGKELRDDSQFCWNCGIKTGIKDTEIKDTDTKDVEIKDADTKDVEIKDADTKDAEIKGAEIKESADVGKLHCRNCGAEVFKNADICIHCGRHLRIVIIKDTGIATVLSFFVPGLGYIYAGEIMIGIVMFALEMLLLGLGIMMIVSLDMKGGYLFLVVGLIFWVYNIFGSYKMAERANKKQYE